VEPSNRPKFIMIDRRWVAAPLMCDIVDWWFFRCFVGHAHTRCRALESHVLCINRRGLGHRYDLWGLIYIYHLMVESPPKTPRFGDGNGDFQSKRLPSNIGNLCRAIDWRLLIFSLPSRQLAAETTSSQLLDVVKPSEIRKR
jgi:hypothetical protein